MGQHYLSLATASVVYPLLYWLELPFFEQYKVSNEPWPWKADHKKWRDLLFQSIALVGINNVLMIPLLAFQNHLMGMEVPFDFSLEGVPTPLKFAFQLLFCAIVEDFVFHMSHRALHTKWLYQKVHKLHHKHIDSVYYAQMTAHPLEFVFGNVLPTVVGPLLLGKRMHLLAVITWFFARNVESAEGHSGYEFPWSPFRWLPFTPGHGYHSFHHSANVGNYSSFFHIWDTIFESNKAYN